MGILAPLSTGDTTTRAAPALGAAPHSRHLKLPGEPTYAHFLETHGPVASGRWVVGTEGTSPKPQGNPGHIPTAQLCSPPGAAGTGSPPPPTRARARPSTHARAQAHTRAHPLPPARSPGLWQVRGSPGDGQEGPDACRLSTGPLAVHAKTSGQAVDPLLSSRSSLQTSPLRLTSARTDGADQSRPAAVPTQGRGLRPWGSPSNFLKGGGGRRGRVNPAPLGRRP